ncbi:asparagine synthase-related protein [Bacteroidota bacterium]
MSTIYGIINFYGQTQLKDELNQMKRALSHWKNDDEWLIVSKNYGFGKLILTPNKRNETVRFQFGNELELMLFGSTHIYNKKELYEKLNIKNNSIEDNELLVHAYLKWGKHFLQLIRGDFVFVIWDIYKQKMLIARDHFGKKAFYYTYSSGRFIFSSEISGILATGIYELNLEWITDSALGIFSDKEISPYNSIYRLPPACYMEVDKDFMAIHKYWDLDISNKIVFKNSRDYVDGFREKLVIAVRNCLDGELKAGTELSGGLDSSCVTAIAARYGNIHAFSHILPVGYCNQKIRDEKEFIQLQLNFSKISDFSSIDAGDYRIVNELSDEIQYTKQISQGNYQFFAEPLIKEAAKLGIRVLLSGFGGDQGVTSHFLGYNNYLIQSRQYKKLFERLKSGNKSQLWIMLRFLNMMFRYYTQNKLALRVLKKDLKFFEQLPVTDSFKYNNYSKEKFLKFHSKPVKNVDEWIYEKTLGNHITHRLESAALKALHYRIEYRYPLLDKELIEYYVSVPIEERIGKGLSRMLMRKALEGFVHPDIQWRNDKTGTTVPNWHSRFLKDENILDKYIIRAKNELNEHYFDYDKLLYWRKCISNSSFFESYIRPRIFINSISIILYQLMTKEENR